MSIVNIFLDGIAFLHRHKVLLVLLLLGFAMPSLYLTAPEILAHLAGWPPLAKGYIAGVAIVVVGAAFIAMARRFFRALVQAWQRRQQTSAFLDGNLPGSEHVAIVWRAAGSVTNVFFAKSLLSVDLLIELAKASRKVLVLPDNSPGVGVDTPPELAIGKSGEKTAEFRKPHVRDDAREAARVTELWTAHQEPFLNSFLTGCEVRVGVHVVAPGCSSLTDSLYGFGQRIRGSEGNLVFFIHDSRADDDPDDDPDDIGDMPAQVLAQVS